MVLSVAPAAAPTIGTACAANFSVTTTPKRAATFSTIFASSLPASFGATPRVRSRPVTTRPASSADRCRITSVVKPRAR
ncbi:hypothetical protein G6F32_016832 [Rhizopus arrhizus]|nr:hypothetical protein G6F32_016832 [Rhizopus arrhizus]